jgi:hypothetical protein
MRSSGWSSPGNVVDLAVLGVASERAHSLRALIGAVRHIGGGRFQPTAEVVAGRIAALAEAGLRVNTWPCVVAKPTSLNCCD